MPELRAGGVPTEQVFSDYRGFNGPKIPMKTTAYQSGKIVNVVRYESVTFNDAPAKMFVPPPEVIKKPVQTGDASAR